MQRLQSLDPADAPARQGTSTGDEDVAELREHGWSDQIVADTVGPVALNLLTGSFTLGAGLEPVPAEQSTKEKHDHAG
ncbi:hypothetical protein [Amycolatopsis sp. cmx-11-12]|uniref:hypothetical protein n=1 Tax=Amycolatopsis sp. cmx-11-12 TaxID=2785795 RepID=UPI003917C7F6